MEKWTARNEAGTWYVEADRSQSFFDVCELFGGGILSESRAHRIAAVPEMEAALEKIASVENVNQLTLANNTIAHIRVIARQALAQIEEA